MTGCADFLTRVRETQQTGLASPFCAAPGRESASAQVARRAEGDQPEHKPQRRNARKGQQRAVDDGVPRREEEEQVDARERIQARAQPVGDQHRAQKDGRQFHAHSLRNTPEFTHGRGAAGRDGTEQRAH